MALKMKERFLSLQIKIQMMTRSMGLKLAIFLGVFFLSSLQAQAMSPTVKRILYAGIVGAAAGTVVGLATYPLHGEVKGIFLGTSVGLYTGLGIGALQAGGLVPEVKLAEAKSRPTFILRQYALIVPVFEF